MNNKSNQVLLGLVIVLVGLFVMFKTFTGFSVGSLMYLFVGLAFLLLYRTKRKIWSLVLGVFIVYTGATGLFKDILYDVFSINLVGATFFLVPGIIFLVIYFDRCRPGLLKFSSFMIWLGAFVALKDVFGGFSPFALFLVFIGLAMLTIYYASKRRERSFYKNFGFLTIIIGLINLFNIGKILPFTFGNFSFGRIVSLVLILIGVKFIFDAYRKKGE